ncbi:MAG: 4Fe-4S binding protein, partial [Candidatus Sumerlaeia bacterium]|nr:4Fe-4S binding protein [Candidatus Sumerlaeia bacterium]
TCGWLCPFGLLQELLYKIPSPKLRIPQWTTKIKYLILAIFVIILPLTLGMELNAYGKQKLAFTTDALRQVWFCKLICPAGTLEAGLPFVIFDSAIRTLLYDTSKLDEIKH